MPLHDAKHLQEELDRAKPQTPRQNTQKIEPASRGSSSGSGDGIILWESDIAKLRASLARLAKQYQQGVDACLDDWFLRAHPSQSSPSSRHVLGQQRAPQQVNVIPAASPTQVSISARSSTQVGIISVSPMDELPGSVNRIASITSSCAGEITPQCSDAASNSVKQSFSRGKNLTKWQARRHYIEFTKNLHSSRKSKFVNDKKHTCDYLTPVAREAAQEHETFMESVVTSKAYEWVIVTMILLNAVLIGIEVQLMAIKAREKANEGMTDWQVPPLFTTFNYAFCCLFVIDLCARWYVDGLLVFFQTKDCMWNAFDIVTVLASILEAIVEIAFSRIRTASDVCMIRVLRVCRIIRVVRVIRVISFFRELRLMIGTLLSSMMSVLWVGVTFALILFIVGVGFTMGVAEFCTEKSLWTSNEHEYLRTSFGTLDRTILTLYMSISGGQSWGVYYEALEPMQVHYRLMFILFTFLSLFALINIVTGIFLEIALSSSRLDRDDVIQMEMEDACQSMQRIRDLFEELDTTNTGSVTMKELRKHLNDERVVAYLRALKLDFEDADTLFYLLDSDMSGEVTFEEFCAGCERLRGDARAMDLAIIRVDLAWLKQLMTKTLDRPVSQAVHG